MCRHGCLAYVGAVDSLFKMWQYTYDNRLNPFAIFQNAYVFQNQSPCGIEGVGVND